MREIPIVNLQDHQALPTQAGKALRDVGFFRLIGHGLTKVEFQAGFDAANTFFNLPAETKSSYHYPDIGGLVGYLHIPANPDKHINYEDGEFWQSNASDLSCHNAPAFPKNRWPSELPELQSSALPLYRGFEKATWTILKALANYLDITQDSFTSLIANGWSTLRYCKYPRPSTSKQRGDIRVDAHEDISVLTFLSAGSAKGLQVRHKGNWISVDGNPEELLVGGGKMLAHLTGGILKSAMHRVLHSVPDTGSERVSIPFFVSPRPEVVLEPLVGSAQAYNRYPREETAHFIQRELGFGESQ